MTWDKIVKWLAALAGAIVGFVNKSWTPMLTALAVLMTVDYISGLIVAACHRSPNTEGGGLSSEAGFIGLAKKGFILILILLATVLDELIGNGTSVFQSSLTLYSIANEGLSILENAGLMGVKYPEKLRKALEAMREKEGKPPDEDE